MTYDGCIRSVGFARSPYMAATKAKIYRGVTGYRYW